MMGLRDYKIRNIMRYFWEDTDSKTSALLNLNRTLFCQKITASALGAGSLFFCEIECDEPYFGARRVRGKKVGGAAGKTPVLPLLKRGASVYVGDQFKSRINAY